MQICYVPWIVAFFERGRPKVSRVGEAWPSRRWDCSLRARIGVASRSHSLISSISVAPNYHLSPKLPRHGLGVLIVTSEHITDLHPLLSDRILSACQVNNTSTQWPSGSPHQICFRLLHSSLTLPSRWSPLISPRLRGSLSTRPTRHPTSSPRTACRLSSSTRPSSAPATTTPPLSPFSTAPRLAPASSCWSCCSP